MSFITINHSLNQTFFVQKEALEQLVVKAGENVKFSKVISSKVEIKKNGIYSVQVHINIKENITLKQSLLELTSEIEKYSYNLIEAKPSNIEIIIEGEI